MTNISQVANAAVFCATCFKPTNKRSMTIFSPSAINIPETPLKPQDTKNMIATIMINSHFLSLLDCFYGMTLKNS